MNTQYRKNLKAVLEASKSYCDESIESLKWELGTYDLSVDTDINTAHIKQLPSDAIQTTVAKVEGVGYKVNQLAENRTLTFTEGTRLNITDVMTFVSGHKYLLTCKQNIEITTSLRNLPLIRTDDLHSLLDYGTSTGTLSLVATNDQNVASGFKYAIYTCSTSVTGVYNYWLAGPSAEFNIVIDDNQLFDLTADFGSGNEPTSVSDCASAYLQRGINIYEYTSQQSSIKNNAFTGVTVKGTNLFNGELENGGYNASGEKVNTYPKRCRCVNPFELEQGTYTFSNTNGYDVAIYCKDIDGNIMYDSGRATSPCSFTINRKSVITAIQIIQDSINPLTPELAGNCMLNYGSTAMAYVPYTSTTISVDLTTIKDSNNVSLFPSGKLMGNSSVADFITPYNQESRWDEVDLGTVNWVKYTTNNVNSFYGAINDKKTGVSNAICSKYDLATNSESFTSIVNSPNQIGQNDTNSYIYFYSDTTASMTAEQFSTYMTGVKLQYERATYLTSNTDLTSLTRINAQSNGTITLNNTDNVDMPNTIKTLKEVAK